MSDTTAATSSTTAPATVQARAEALFAGVTAPSTATSATPATATAAAPSTTAKHAAAAPVDVDPEQDLVSLPGLGEVDLRTATSSAPPQITTAADGTTRIVLTWTKNTKAHVGTALAAVTDAGILATAYVLPASSPYTHWCQVALGVVGLAATWLGIHLTTNLPRKSSN
ncbi:hypothetical protein [Curtobacterium oceanosedimentum]|uniref:hypothetical protein n=1 Tax=Curtobacterium oceanosedimentum TaxID=465820 RepID=UPI003390EA91